MLGFVASILIYDIEKLLMTFDRQQRLKMRGLTEVPGPADPVVIGRRKYHEAAAKWCAKWFPVLQLGLVLISFFIVFLPVIAKPWRVFIEATPVLSYIFYSYSKFRGLLPINLCIVSIVPLVALFTYKDLPGGSKNAPIIYLKDVFEMELYPQTRKQEIAYWINMSANFLLATGWLIMPFGILAFFINLRG